MYSEAELRRQLAEFRRSRRRRGESYPPELRAAVVTYVQDGREQGRSVAALCARLGLSQQTLVSWMKRAARVRPVELRGGRVSEPSDSRGQAVLVSPFGYRVEGLEIGELAELLKALA